MNSFLDLIYYYKPLFIAIHCKIITFCDRETIYNNSQVYLGKYFPTLILGREWHHRAFLVRGSDLTTLHIKQT